MAVDEEAALQYEDGEREKDWGEEANVSWEESCLLILDLMKRINDDR